MNALKTSFGRVVFSFIFQEKFCLLLLALNFHCCGLTSDFLRPIDLLDAKYTLLFPMCEGAKNINYFLS